MQEKILNITSHQGNANKKKTMGYHLTTVKIANIKKTE